VFTRRHHVAHVRRYYSKRGDSARFSARKLRWREATNGGAKRCLASGMLLRVATDSPAAETLGESTGIVVKVPSLRDCITTSTSVG